jgi:hypothetical protein
MKRVAHLVAVMMMLSPLAFSQEPPPSFPPQLVLDKISFQASAKQWVTTQTALLGVEVNVALNNSDLVKTRIDIMSSLNKITQGDWHLVQFDRSQDSSGLEKLYVQAQARVAQSSLVDIYQKAKAISKPGAQYTINGVEFKPSLEEIQAVRATIRKQLYQLVSDELGRINKVYPNQNYTANNIVISEGDNPQPPIAYQAKTMNTMVLGAAAAPAPAPLSVSNELVLTAYVEAASNRKPAP